MIKLEVSAHDFSIIAGSLTIRKSFLSKELIPCIKHNLEQCREMNEDTSVYESLLKDYETEYNELCKLYNYIWNFAFNVEEE